jgi:hypothetical protein
LIFYLVFIVFSYASKGVKSYVLADLRYHILGP